MDLHVIPHTHWDREWHKTFQEYRVKLVEFMDDLILLLEKDEAYHSFMLDGQTIVLEDYLEIRPYMKQRIRNAIEKGKLIIGPWYIQPDEFIPSGESLVRNLLISKRISDEYGSYMPIGYLPDSFGQSAQIPQVLRGFGIDSAVFWRGITEEETEKTEFLWEGPDGSQVIAVHLKSGYGNARMLSLDIDRSIQIVEENMNNLKGKSSGQDILLMCGFDQYFASKDLPEIINRLNAHYQERQQDVKLSISSLEAYIHKIRKNVETLHILAGEFRKGKNMRVHISIGATRLDIKKENRISQTLFEKYVEPVNTMAYVLGDVYDNDIINHGWKLILQNHAHDSICCVCTDATHQEMIMRYKAAQQIGNCIKEDKYSYLTNQINYQTDFGIPITVYNTLAHDRKDIVKATLHLENDDFELFDNEGNSILYQVLEVDEVNLADKEIEIGIKNKEKLVKQYKIVFFAEVKGLGYRTYYVKENTKSMEIDDAIAKKNVLENQFLRIKINKNGTLNIEDKRTAKIYNDLHVIEESGNAGDEYDFSPPLHDRIISSENLEPTITLLQNGAIMASVEVKYEIDMPLDTDAKGRSEETKRCIVKSYITLYRDIDRVDIKTVIENKVKNHRIRALFNSNLKTSKHVADQQFGVIERENYLKESEYFEKEKWEEKYYPIYPQQKFVDFSDGKSGLAILNKGLPQYEILNKDEPIFALTLLSGTDFMGKQDLLYRPGRRSGLHIKTPDSLMLGEFETEYAIIPHNGTYKAGKIALKSAEYDAPYEVKVGTCTSKNAKCPDELQFIKVLDDDVAVSSIKKAEKDDSIILRIYNTTNQMKQKVQIQYNEFYFNKVEYVDLKEEKLPDEDRIKTRAGLIEIENMKSNEILTFKLYQRNHDAEK